MDDAKLKERLKDGLLTLLTEENFSSRKTEVPGMDSRRELKEVTDEQFQRVLMELYKEAESKWPTLTPNTGEWVINKQVVISVLACLHMCADSQTKDFLLDYAGSKEKDAFSRTIALSSYLRAADPEETKHALLRFLVEGDRMEYMERLSIYEYARMVYDSADELKRAAILHALYVAASGTDVSPWEFRVCDEILERISPAYAKSSERFSLLKKHNAASYPKMREHTKKDLKERFEKMQKIKKFTNISTNLAALKSRDFNVPRPDLSTNDVVEASPDHPNTPSAADNTAERGIGTSAFFGLAALLLLGFGAWKLKAR